VRGGLARLGLGRLHLDETVHSGVCNEVCSVNNQHETRDFQGLEPQAGLALGIVITAVSILGAVVAVVKLARGPWKACESEYEETRYCIYSRISSANESWCLVTCGVKLSRDHSYGICRSGRVIVAIWVFLIRQDRYLSPCEGGHG